MVRNYIRKTEDKYSERDLNQALKEIRDGIISKNVAAKKYKIPYMTLSSRIAGNRGTKSSTRGRGTAIPNHAEKELANGLKILEKWGWGLSRKEILDTVQEYVKENQLETPFKNNRPGEDWFLKFKSRHNLSVKKPQSVEYARKKCLDPRVINDYFALLKNVIKESNLENHPERIFNLDESSFCLDPSKTKVVGQRGKPSSRTVSGPGRENTTILLAASATGYKIPPLIIFKAKNLWNEWVAPENLGFPNTAYAASTKGWMETEIFKNYFKDTFIPSIGRDRPVLVIYDGHSTHVHIDLISMAIEENIIILKLPPHSSHLLQPLDLSVFRSLKQTWDEKLVTWQRRNIGKKLPKKEFSIMIGNIWREIDPAVIQSGFRKAGICPLNPDIIPKENIPPAPMQMISAESSSPVVDIQIPSTSTSSSSTNHCVAVPVFRMDATLGRNVSVSFEHLLLDKVRKAPIQQKISKKKITSGSEVITSVEVVERIRAMAEKRDAPKKEPKRSKRLLRSPSPSTSEATDVLLNLSNDENEEEWRNEILAEILDKTPHTSPSKKGVGDWVLVKYQFKNSEKCYVGQIIGISSNDKITIKFARKKGTNSTFIWPQVEDSCEVPSKYIEMILPIPQEDRRGRLNFTMGFAGYNMQ